MLLGGARGIAASPRNVNGSSFVFLGAEILRRKQATVAAPLAVIVPLNISFRKTVVGNQLTKWQHSS